MLQRNILLPLCVLFLAVGCSEDGDEGTGPDAGPAVSTIPQAWDGVWDVAELVVGCPYEFEPFSWNQTAALCGGQDFEARFWNGREWVTVICAGTMTDDRMDLVGDLTTRYYFEDISGEVFTNGVRFRAFIKADRNGDSGELWAQLQTHWLGPDFRGYFCDEFVDTMTRVGPTTPQLCATPPSPAPGAERAAVGMWPGAMDREPDITGDTPGP